MRPVELSDLNAQLGIPKHVAFVLGPGGLPTAEVQNDHATATISMYGGQVLAYQPHGTAPVLWASKHSYYQPGKAIRGGIPVCWPWFGPHPTDSELPAHGFVRTSQWAISGTRAAADGATEVRLELSDAEQTRALWPHSFHLELIVVVGPVLSVELVVRNTGEQQLTYTGALHSYFTVSDITNIAIDGLDGVQYIDQLQPGPRFIQKGAIAISSETDRIYLDTAGTCVIEDAGLGRRISIGKAGSRSTVVWNPWVAKAQRMRDFGDEEYREMVCIETTNAADDRVTVPEGGTSRLQATIAVELDA